MYCTICGTENSTDSSFCYNCGRSLLPIGTISTVKAESLSSSASTSALPSAPPPKRPHKLNFIRMHWRGDYSLAVSYWVIGALLSIMLLGVMTLLTDSNGIREIDSKTGAFAFLSIYAICIAITFWQLIGIWRSSEKHVSRGGKSGWAAVAKVMVVLGFFKFIGDLGNSGAPLISENAKVLAGIDNTPPYAIRLLQDGTELELAGGMPFGTTDAVKRFLDAAPAIQVIHLNSQGGRMKEAYALYKTIKERKLITFTSSVCASACSIAFLAGRERLLGEGGRLGFHSVRIGDVSGEIAKELNDDVRQTMANHNVPSAFIDRALSTSPKDMWYPTNDELLTAHVIDLVVDSRYFGLSGITQWRHANDIELELLKVPTFSALAQYDQQSFAKMRNVLVEGIKKGRSQLVIQNDMRAILFGAMPRYLKTAPDAPLTRYWRSQIAEMRHLGNQNPQQCADLAFPQFAKTPLDLQRLLPKAMLSEDLEALAEVIKGVATNPQGFESSPIVQADFEMILKKIAKQYPWALEPIVNPTKYKEQPLLLCGGIVVFFSEILALPSSNRAGSLLRHVASQ